MLLRSFKGLVLASAAGIELDQTPNAAVLHNEISGGVQNGGINLDCHGDCEFLFFKDGTLNHSGTKPALECAFTV